VAHPTGPESARIALLDGDEEARAFRALNEAVGCLALMPVGDGVVERSLAAAPQPGSPLSP
jgi:hypothetical protein